MTQLFDELIQQPVALRNLVHTYQKTDLLSQVVVNLRKRRWILTGMGASYHAAGICAFHMNSLGVDAMAIETVDFLHYQYQHSLPRDGICFVYISQSGESGEVQPFFERISRIYDVVGISNNSNSTLGNLSRWILPLEAGEEALIASKTYINSLALLWLLARKVAQAEDGSEWTTLLSLADRMESMLDHASRFKELWANQIIGVDPLIFLGHGPHAFTARQAAMILSEWPKMTVFYSGIGAFRHGFIETAQPDMGAVIITSQGSSSASTLDLVGELKIYGVKVLVLENGSSEKLESIGQLDEFLSPMLDIIPVQLFADEMSVRLKIPTGFRHLKKVVKNI